MLVTSDRVQIIVTYIYVDTICSSNNSNINMYVIVSHKIESSFVWIIYLVDKKT